MSKPKIRFTGYSDIWSSDLLSNYADRVRDKNYAMEVKEIFTNSAEFGVISQNDFFNHSIAKQDKIGGYYIVSPDDFVYNPRISVTAPVGPINRNRLNKCGVMSPLYTVFKTHDILPDFLELYFKTSLWHKYMRFNGNSGARHDRFSISNVEFFNMPIPTPDDGEQEIISFFLNDLNVYIQRTTNELEKLKILKQASLKAMFPQDGEPSPRVRFNGFSDSWIETTLGECFVERQDRSGIGELLSVTIGDGVRQFKDLNRHDNSSANKSNYKVVHIGDIAYNSMRMWQGASGCSEYDGIVSPAYTVIIPNQGINPRFFACYFKNEALIHKFRINSQGLTSDTWNLKFPQFSSISISYPTNEDEQKLIAEYFYQLNKEIKLKTEELEKLRHIKTSCLNGMFVNPE